MISIITAIHNGLPFNQLFLESLRQYTFHPFQLIIIDNASSDGSTHFFENEGCMIIRNEVNQNYPYSQNQGMQKATGEYLFFLNNDLIVSPQWDKRLIEAATLHKLDIISACGIENAGNAKITKQLRRKWKRTKNALLILGVFKTNLKLMHWLMYGNWKRFCDSRFDKFGHQVVEGIVGNNVMMTRKAVSIVNRWDERVQQADFDLFIRVKKRALEMSDIKPCGIALGVYIHHYIRMTSKYARPLPFAGKENMIDVNEKYSEEEFETFHPDNATLRKK
ncbi:MAG: glycosyltransferase [Bacteroidota bacterium]|nr:glycosyltransferase [Bacteroidota bacterium]